MLKPTNEYQPTKTTGNAMTDRKKVNNERQVQTRNCKKHHFNTILKDDAAVLPKKQKRLTKGG
jgi:hypothetical protein